MYFHRGSINDAEAAVDTVGTWPYPEINRDTFILKIDTPSGEIIYFYEIGFQLLLPFRNHRKANSKICKTTKFKQKSNI